MASAARLTSFHQKCRAELLAYTEKTQHFCDVCWGLLQPAKITSPIMMRHAISIDADEPFGCLQCSYPALVLVHDDCQPTADGPSEDSVK